jgi:hypothetical protein
MFKFSGLVQVGFPQITQIESQISQMFPQQRKGAAAQRKFSQFTWFEIV